MTGPRVRTGLQPRSKMFLRMLLRGALVRRGRALSALLAVVVAAAAATAMLTVYQDVQAKLGKEFRKYGANVIVVAKPGQALPPSTLSRIETALDGHGTAVPFAYVVASTSNGSPIVVAGTDMKSVQQLDSWWSVSAWPKLSGDALVGNRAAAALGAESGQFELKFQGRSTRLNPVGTLETGAAEDS